MENVNEDNEKVLDNLDKLVVNFLHLIEMNLNSNLLLEQIIDQGNHNLAKSRFLLGHKNVSALQIPTNSMQASLKSIKTKDDWDLVNDIDNDSNPLKWFGILLPTNLKSARTIFVNSLESVIDLINIQTRFNRVCDQMLFLIKYKNKYIKQH